MQCPACKTSVPAESLFCGKCGAKMPGSSSQSEVRDENQQLVHSQVTRVGPAGAESPSVATTAGQALTQRYELMEEVGRGGFAVVYKARDRKLDRLVAVKRLLTERAAKGEDDQAVQRFLREATMIASLSHRNIVQVYDHDQDEEGYYIVMELITGGTLRQRLKDLGKMKVPEAVEMMRGICQGMGHAHRKNLVHRDIKPANILLAMESGETVVPKLVDFGLARGAEESRVSLDGYGMGTPAYMAPEQRRNAKGVNHTADIYALGKTLYEMVSGESPENVDTEAIPGVEGLGRIILKCIKTRPEDRYFSVDELRQELEGLRIGSAVATGSKTPASANACPNCQTANPVDARFCDACGTGLTRVCPECEKENTVHQKHCRGCGTEMQGYLDLQKVLGEMEKYGGEKRWSRVVKEGKEVAREIRLPGKKGRQIRQKVEECGREAEERLATREQLTSSMEAAWKGQEYEKSKEVVEKLIELDPHDEGLPRRLEAIEESIENRDYGQAKADAEKAEEGGKFEEARRVWEMFLSKLWRKKGRKEAEGRVVLLKQLEEGSGALDRALAAGEFEVAAGHLKGMRELKCGERLGERLKREIEEKARSYAELVTGIEGLQKEGKLEEAKTRTESGMKEFPKSRVLGELAEECKEGLGFVKAEREVGELLEQGQVEKAIELWAQFRNRVKSASIAGRAKASLDTLQRAAKVLEELGRKLAGGELEAGGQLLSELEAMGEVKLTRLAKGQLDRKRQEFEQAIAAAKGHLERRELEEALKQVEAALVLDKFSERAQKLCGEIEQEVILRNEATELAVEEENQGRFEKSLELWQKVAVLDSGLECNKDIVRLTSKRDEFKQAMATARQHLERRELEEALKQVEAALVLDKFSERAQKLRGEIEQEVARRDEATELAVRKEREGEFTEALELWQKVAGLDQWDCRKDIARLEAKLEKIRRGRHRAILVVTGVVFVVLTSVWQYSEWGKRELARKKAMAIAEAAYLKSGNSLGMRFARVSGTEVLFSVWETRVRDYDGYVKEKGLKWEKPGFEQGPEHPAVVVSWDDAKAFCLWLTGKERREGRLGLKEEYRLPTDLEWSAAVGLPKEGRVPPRERSAKIRNVYPWGSQWPPPKGAGNYYSSLSVDDFKSTSSAGSFAGNQYGLYDLGGNVWEWCEDWYDVDKRSRVLRGGSWVNGDADILLSSYRLYYAPDYRYVSLGFRVVLVGLCSTKAGNP